MVTSHIYRFLKKVLSSFNALKGIGGENTSTPCTLVLSSISGIITVWSTAPFWVVNMRLKGDNENSYTGISNCFISVIRNEGITSLWNGTMASMLLVSNPVIHYVTYEYLKNVFGDGGKEFRTFFFTGACSKMLATMLTYPLQVAQSKMRVSFDYELFFKTYQRLQRRTMESYSA